LSWKFHGAITPFAVYASAESLIRPSKIQYTFLSDFLTTN